MLLSFLLIPLITIAVALIGAYFTKQGLKVWYPSIKRPSWTPPQRVIGMTWPIIYILTAASALIVWNLPSLAAPAASISTAAAAGASYPSVFWLIMKFFALNAAANVAWSFTFFYKHQIGVAVWISAFLELTVLILIVHIAPFSALAAWLLAPYAAWVAFTTYLDYRIGELNKVPRPPKAAKQGKRSKWHGF